MSATKTCLACGHEGTDVRMTLVEHDDPQPVTVRIPVSFREGAIEVPTEVPGRYGAEWRCVDQAACQERVAALEPVMSDVVPVVEAEPEPVDEEFVLP